MAKQTDPAANEEKADLMAEWIDKLGLDEVLLLMAEAVGQIPPESASYRVKGRVVAGLKSLAKLDAF